MGGAARDIESIESAPSSAAPSFWLNGVKLGADRHKEIAGTLDRAFPPA
jgi:hypothetical protein